MTTLENFKAFPIKPVIREAFKDPLGVVSNKISQRIKKATGVYVCNELVFNTLEEYVNVVIRTSRLEDAKYMIGTYKGPCTYYFILSYLGRSSGYSNIAKSSIVRVFDDPRSAYIYFFNAYMDKCVWNFDALKYAFVKLKRNTPVSLKESLLLWLVRYRPKRFERLSRKLPDALFKF